MTRVSLQGAQFGFDSSVEGRSNAVQRWRAILDNLPVKFCGQPDGNDSIIPGDTVDPDHTGKDGNMIMHPVHIGLVMEPHYLEGELPLNIFSIPDSEIPTIQAQRI